MTVNPVRGFLAVAITGLLVAAPACGDEPTYFEPSHAEGTGTPPSPTDAEAAEGAETVIRVTDQLNPSLATETVGSTYAWSPLALTSTLAQLRAGSRGDLASGLDELFGTDGGSDAFVRSIHAADETARRLDGPTGGTNGELRQVEVARGDALWGRSGTTWSAAFLDDLTGGFGASMWMADVENDPDRARTAIDQWVAGQTNGQVDRIMPTGSVDEQTRLVITSALAFSAPWETPMQTLPDAPFVDRFAEDPEVDVPTIGVEAPLVARTGPSWRAVTVPFAGGASAMTVIVPEGDRLPDGPSLLAEVLPELGEPGEPSPVALSMPAFSIDTPLGGIQTLEASQLFAPGADLFPMSGDPDGRPLRVDALQQRTVVRVDAAGASLPEATIEGRSEGETGPSSDVEEFVVGGPFAFVIHDVAFGTPLIVGWVREAPTRS